MQNNFFFGGEREIKRNSGEWNDFRRVICGNVRAIFTSKANLIFFCCMLNENSERKLAAKWYTKCNQQYL